jgi:hypothetical protein
LEQTGRSLTTEIARADQLTQPKVDDLNARIRQYNADVDRVTMLGSPGAERLRKRFFPSTAGEMIMSANLSPIEQAFALPLVVPLSIASAVATPVTLPAALLGHPIPVLGEMPSPIGTGISIGISKAFGTSYPEEEAGWFGRNPILGAGMLGGELFGGFLLGKGVGKVTGAVSGKITEITEIGEEVAPRATKALDMFGDFGRAITYPGRAIKTKVSDWAQDIYAGAVEDVQRVTGKVLYTDVRPGVSVTANLAGMDVESGPFALRGTRIEAGSILAPISKETVRVPWLDMFYQQEGWFATQSDITQRSAQNAWRLLAGDEVAVEMGGYGSLTPIGPSLKTTITKFGATRVGPTIEKSLATGTYVAPTGGIPAGGLPILAPQTFADITSNILRNVRPTQVYFPAESAFAGGDVLGSILAGAAIGTAKAPGTIKELSQIGRTNFMSLPEVRRVASSLVGTGTNHAGIAGAIIGTEPIAGTTDIARMMEIAQPAQAQTAVQRMQQLQRQARQTTTKQIFPPIINPFEAERGQERAPHEPAYPWQKETKHGLGDPFAEFVIGSPNPTRRKQILKAWAKGLDIIGPSGRKKKRRRKV